MPHYVLYQFRPFDTITAILRLKGRHNYTFQEIAVLLEKFNELNGIVVPKPGQIFKIPLQPFVVDDYGNLIDVSLISKEVPIEPNPCDDCQNPTEHEHAGDPHEPVYDFPVVPVPSKYPEESSQQYRNQQVSPDTSENPSNQIKKQVVESISQPVLSVTGIRRRS